MILDRLIDGAEDDARLQELLLEGGSEALAVENNIDGHVRQSLLLGQRDTELFKGTQQLGVDLVQTLLLLCRLGPREVDDILEVDGLHFQVSPVRHSHALPFPEGIQPEVQHPIRLPFDLRDLTDNILVEPFRNRHGLDICGEAKLVLLVEHSLEVCILTVAERNGLPLINAKIRRILRLITVPDRHDTAASQSNASKCPAASCRQACYCGSTRHNAC
mmetsp:Transcript_130136/g.278077  ORF Transcript_130136/g.278077 Transcript_130136/m.278077 type:complete len:218 (+) Transcript_130136:1050-1703(+)